MSSALNGRVAIVTGGNRGIGLSVAQELVKAGVKVAIAARSAEHLRVAADALTSSGGSVTELVLDVSDREACFAAVAAVTEELGAPDILLNGAGIHTPSAFLDYTVESMEKMMQVNFFGTFNMMQAVLPGMIEKKRGRIVNISSTAGKWASSNQAGYNASKHAVIGLTRSVAMEIGTSGVTVNAICPGLVDTEMADELFQYQAKLQRSPVEEVRARSLSRVSTGEMIAPSEVARLAMYLVSDAARGMTGQSIVLDGGRLFV